MAGFTMQVQSAISPFVCTLASGQPPFCLRCGTPPGRACPYATKIISREPNTPLAFRRWNVCHLKQQAGHEKITVGFGQGSQGSIFRIADYDNLYFTYSSAEEQIRTLTKLLFRGTVTFGAKTHQRYPSLSKRKIITKLTKLFGKTLYSPMSCLLYMVLILSSPIFGLGLSCL